MKNIEAKPFGNLKAAKVLVIGHDPRLQLSDTIAEFCFFSDYFFKAIPKSSSELRKYNLAANLFAYLGWITSYKYTAADYYITNLCNEALVHAPKGKTVLIPDRVAEEGVERLKSNVNQGDFNLILPMSQQVNYWLQHFGFYNSEPDYLKLSEPKDKGIIRKFYEPIGKAPFLMICGKRYAYHNIPIIPILHVKQFPLKGIIKKNYLPLLHKGIDDIKIL